MKVPGYLQKEMYKTFFSTYFTLCVLLSVFSGAVDGVYAQSTSKTSGKYIKINHTRRLVYDKTVADAKRLIGDVECEHDGAIVRCDSAYMYDDKKIEAFGHISINKDSVFIYGDKLFYDSGTKLATLDKNVRCIDKDMLLTTDVLFFDVQNSVAHYYTGATIVSKENTLTSQNGHYYSKRKEVAFHYDVVLKNSNYTMKSDTLLYNTSTKTAYFVGPSIITSKSNYIYCENGFYDTQKEYSRFSKNALVVTKDQKITGDSMYYDRKNGYSKIMNHVLFIDTTNKSVITGNLAEHYEKNNKIIVTNKALYGRLIQKDTVFVSADTLFYYEPDSTHSFVKAGRHVKIYKKEIQGICDSLNYAVHDSVMNMYNSPVLWAKNGQVTAKQMVLRTGGDGIKDFELIGNAMIIEKADSLDENKFNQIAGRKIQGFMKNDTIRKVNIMGNAQIIYYIKQKQSFKGVNKTNCSDITVWLGGKEGLDKVTFKNKPESVVLPLSDVDDKELRLKGFIWLENKRPKSKSELFLK